MKSVAVVGGGVAGLCCAWYLAEAGHEVVVVDSRPEGHWGCSWGNSGMVVPSHFVPLAAPGMVSYGLRHWLRAESPFGIRFGLDPDAVRWGARFVLASTAERVEAAAPLLRDLNRASLDLYRDLAKQWDNPFGLSESGLLMMCQKQKALDEEADTAEKAQRMGIRAEVMDSAGVAQLDPDSGAQVIGAVFYPDDASLEPHRFMEALAQRLSGRADFRWRTSGRFLPGPGRSVSLETGAGPIRADEYVLATGAWTSQLAKPLGLPLPMLAGKGYSLTLADPPIRPRICSLWPEYRLAATPMGGAVRFGGTMEIGPPDESVNVERVSGIRRAAERAFPAMAGKLEDVTVWSGLRPCTPDGLPYLGRTERFSNLVVAAGHAMMGMSLGPVTGQVVAQLISGERPDFGLALANPDRYS